MHHVFVLDQQSFGIIFAVIEFLECVQLSLVLEESLEVLRSPEVIGFIQGPLHLIPLFVQATPS